jgi:CPA2 family monovalent cation:H+ antiporter-2
MLDSHEFIRNLALVLCVAAATSFLFQRLRQPVVFGYLLAGMIVGPHVPLPLAANAQMVTTLSELGVILLMFALGLEFSIRKLLAVGPTAGVIAVLQTSAMVALGFLAGQIFGWTRLESVYAGACIAISSTTIIVKAFAEQQTRGRFTTVAFGVLIIEDLIAIFLLAILTAISAGGGITAADLAATAGKLTAFLLGMLVIGLLGIPRMIRGVVKLDSPEAITVTAIGICFGGAWLALHFGYSVALGAFIVGSLVAESGEEKTVEHLVAPVKDVFAAIFFVSVGMLIDPRLIVAHWVPVLVFTILVIVGKVVAVSIGAFLAGYGTRTSVQTGMSLAQIGEFSFIIAGVGLSTGATREFLYPVAVAVSAITTLTTPLLIRRAGAAASFVDRNLPKRLQTFVSLYGTWMERLRSSPTDARRRSRERRLIGLLLLDTALLAAVIVGSILFFDAAVAELDQALQLSASATRAIVFAVAAGLAAPFLVGFWRLYRELGQVLSFRALPAPAPGRADLAAAPRRAFMVTWQLAIGVLLSVPLLALGNTVVPTAVSALIILLLLSILGVIFWRGATNLQGHTRAGAEIIVAALGKQMAGSVSMGGTETLEMPLPSIHELSPEAMAEMQNTRESRPMTSIYDMIPGLGEPVSLLMNQGDFGVGKSLSELDLRDTTDASILVIVRNGDPIVLPVGREVLQVGDLLALAGTPDAVERGKKLLQTGPDK